MNKGVKLKTYPECVQCFFRQARDAAKLAGADDDTRKKVLEEVAAALSDLSLDITPPEIARTVYGIVGRHTDGKDAYKQIKERSNDMAMELYPRLKKVVEKADDVLLSAVRLAVAGNVIDYGVPHSFDIEEEIDECLNKDFAVFDFDDFRDKYEAASNVLYLLDNAGEIVFDRILIEEMKKDVVCAVREKPIINDVTMADARQVGLDKITKVTSSGSNIPGTVVRTARSSLSLKPSAPLSLVMWDAGWGILFLRGKGSLGQGAWSEIKNQISKIKNTYKKCKNGIRSKGV